MKRNPLTSRQSLYLGHPARASSTASRGLASACAGRQASKQKGPAPCCCWLHGFPELGFSLAAKGDAGACGWPGVHLIAGRDQGGGGYGRNHGWDGN